jgi:hypothetical protein
LTIYCAVFDLLDADRLDVVNLTRFQVPTSTNIEMAVFRNVASCNFVDTGRRFRGFTASIIALITEAVNTSEKWPISTITTLHDITSKKTTIFIVTLVDSV